MSENISLSNGLQLNQFVTNLKTSNNNLNKKSKTQSGFLNKKSENKTVQKSKSSSTIANKTILAKKGQAGYMREFDLDDDGKISLEEFNEYCEQNGIDGKDKLRLLTLMQTANSNEKVTEETLKESDKESNKAENKAIYAKKGDEKYDEAMDENKNGEVTYAEYYKYMQEQDKKSEKTEDLSQNNQSEADYDLEEYIPKTIEPEVNSTVEYEG